MMKKILIIIGTIGCVALYSACKKEAPVYVTAPPSITIFDIVRVSPSYSLFREAVERAGVDSVLASGSLTLLLPDNNAFAGAGILRNTQIDSLDMAYLRQFVLYHVLTKALLSTEVPLALETPYLNLLGDTLYFSQPVPGSQPYRNSGGLSYGQASSGNPDFLHVNGDTILSVDTRAANGYIDVLSSPLKLPAASVQSFLASDTSRSIFVAGLKKFGLFDELTGPGPFTVLAPTNSAFLQWGITRDSINTLDTLHFKKYLFGAYVLTPHLFFYSDLWDGPVIGNPLPLSLPTVTPNFNYSTEGAFFSPDGILVWLVYGDAGFWVLNPVSYVAPNSNQPSYNLLGPSGPAGPPPYPYYFQVTTINNGDRDHIAHNGVVHGIDNILVYPDSVRIQ